MKRRTLALVAIPITVALGLGSRRFPLGFALWDKSLGDVAYAALLGFLLVAARPRLAPRSVGITTFLACAAIEVFQLTGIPRRLPRWHFLLGDTFAWHDLACYAVGAFLVALVAVLGTPRNLA